MLEWVAHVGAETDSLGHPCSRQAVGQQAPFDRRTSHCDQVGGESQTMHRRTAGAHVAEHEPEHRQAGQLSPVAVSSVGDIVTEPGRYFGCVRDAADPRERSHVVQGAALVALETDVFAETSGDEPRAQDVLHGLPQAKVHGQRERSKQLRQPETRVAFGPLHVQSLRVGLSAPFVG